MVRTSSGRIGHGEGGDAARSLVAFRELGHVRLKWFRAWRAGNVANYEVYRAEGFMKPSELIKTTRETSLVDEPPLKDKAYYYHVVAVDAGGKRSRPSNEDNAQALSKPRFWDAEVVQHTVPQRMRLGEAREVNVTLRNTGARAWELARPKSEIRFLLNTTQLWGDQEESRLPKIDLPAAGVVSPGQTVTLTLPYAAIRGGRSENHWVCAWTLRARGTSTSARRCWWKRRSKVPPNVSAQAGATQRIFAKVTPSAWSLPLVPNSKASNGCQWPRSGSFRS